jgi:hypothetical protein
MSPEKPYFRYLSIIILNVVLLVGLSPHLDILLVCRTLKSLCSYLTILQRPRKLKT